MNFILFIVFVRYKYHCLRAYFASLQMSTFLKDPVGKIKRLNFYRNGKISEGKRQLKCFVKIAGLENESCMFA